MTAPAPSRLPAFAVFSHAFNMVVALAAIFTAAFVIPRFEAIFHDMLGPEPLPPLTAFVLRFQSLWLLLGVAYLLAAFYMAWRYRLDGPPASPSVVMILLTAAQVGLIIIALFLPLTGTIIVAKAQTPQIVPLVLSALR
ncbi:MAG: hypothetical protein WDN28_16310 [Chthoniobacter sp.]